MIFALGETWEAKQWRNMDESRKHAEQKKLGAKGYILDSCIYMKF